MSEARGIVGKFDACVKYEDQEHVLTLLVIASSGPSLIDRNWMEYIHFNWRSVHLMRDSNYPQDLVSLLERYQSVFDGKLGTMKSFTANLEARPNSSNLVWCLLL